MNSRRGRARRRRRERRGRTAGRRACRAGPAGGCAACPSRASRAGSAAGCGPRSGSGVPRCRRRTPVPGPGRVVELVELVLARSRVRLVGVRARASAARRCASGPELRGDELGSDPPAVAAVATRNCSKARDVLAQDPEGAVRRVVAELRRQAAEAVAAVVLLVVAAQEQVAESPSGCMSGRSAGPGRRRSGAGRCRRGSRSARVAPSRQRVRVVVPRARSAPRAANSARSRAESSSRRCSRCSSV